ncbi:3-deoxy-7-phosphoheptulonate synthase [Lysinibacillus sphaericus]|uniref:3-deoxy-D-arabinoheptulosonate-7-phosphate synthase n=4 Tax=Lysinibacillus TaxID=400634 RepID=A0A2S0JXP1_LYSSH|nr:MULTISPECIES: bifunctional 3-deoxy-7-phosphoheptulonate synthase/chorismate mutase [Lysinibacillus]AHN22930.1 3-deoxy-7-phosphoheptulonate synthase [Lysinibacillus varians]AVK95861.1 bifunctional 3-deoxy-7-phosphoheptulonate synthase/chorismate mutase [Lysinibacillus sphaericus]MCS1380636.1 bifunctional 3-deoxy-7-phosphoheptulonate synthase/chorismate mutase [Lysinibacillus sphaericus]MED4544937.1 bifunctional 3-deoxy-7-phosphoheptulonate synthase/chorismate mutase [Lysinibacillus sphaericus
MSQKDLESLRSQIDGLNLEILRLINERAAVVDEIGKIKEKQGVNRYDPLRERHMLDLIKEHNHGPLNQMTVDYIFKQIFKTALKQLEADKKKELLVSRKKKSEDTVINVNGELIGQGKPSFVFGPCAVESYEQVAAVAASIKAKGEKLIRGGAYKPRTSPYDFQGLGLEGLKILKRVSEEYGLGVITEIVTPGHLEEALDYIDVIQIGARNMQNFELLKAAGATNKPVLLKRGLAATIDEFIHAAEYIMSKGNENIILCERGIRTYEKATRNTLDISAVPILKQETHLPVFVDVTHSTGRRDLLLPCAKAAIAIGADGVMAEVHPDPSVALSDSQQQMDIPTFDAFYETLQKFMKNHEIHA